MTNKIPRRRLLALGGSIPVVVSGCVSTPGGGNGQGGNGAAVDITARMAQPAVPVDYDAAMVDSVATSERPARLRVTLTNPTEQAVVVGEERAVKFHHIESTDTTLYLHPASNEPWDGPVEPGCWQLTDFVAVPEYYGTIALDAGETVEAESFVYGHPDLPTGTCLPVGEHRVRMTGVAGDEEAVITDNATATEFEWGFTLRISD